MALLQIHEPGQTPLPHSDERLAVGIDLGTTNSLIAIAHAGDVEIIRDVEGNSLHPSIVGLDQAGRLVAGNATHGSDESQKIRSFKRLMGQGKDDITHTVGIAHYQINTASEEGMVQVQLGDKVISPVELSSLVLSHLKHHARQALDQDITRAVITVPAYFDDAARHATKDAAKLAGIEVLRLINEPTAAALAYGLDNAAEGIYVIYDLGGGTFDLSILKMEKGVFQVLATGGDTQLGGDDFDRAIVEIMLQQYQHETKRTVTLETDQLNELLVQARIMKEQFTEESSVSQTININNEQWTFTLSREQFNTTIIPIVDKTISICEQVMEDAQLSTDVVKEIVLVGGATRTCLVREKIETWFGTPPLATLNPDEVVAVGAALQAEALTRGSNNLLLDVTPLSLGIETMGGIVEKIVQRNSPIPTSVTQEFTTYQDNQTGMKIHVLQGEREMADQCRSLAHFELTNIPPMKAGVARIAINFTVDTDGLLIVSATEKNTQAMAEVTVKPTYGLSIDTIEHMLYESMEKGADDMELRLLTEQQVEANRVLLALKAALKEDSQLLNPQELKQLEKRIESLEKTVHSGDRHAIKQTIDSLEKEIEVFASRQMNKHLKTALKGKHVNTVDGVTQEGES